jgi:predicted lysophospholipase L1 biosynthesis ABC-type transport system permease subunit
MRAAEIFPKRRNILCCLAAETAAVHATRSKSESMNSKIAEQSRLLLMPLLRAQKPFANAV